MHRAINIKHRVVRRVNIEIAPLATFDTIDLGDEDEPIKKSLSDDEEDLHKESKDKCNSPVLTQHYSSFSCNVEATELLPSHESVIQTRIIGGNTSKKSLTQAGGDKSQKETGGLHSGTPTSTSKHGDNKTEVPPDQRSLPAPEQPSSPPCDESRAAIPVSETQARRVPYDRQGSLGRVSLPVRQPDSSSSSSSSSPECHSEHTFTFQTLKAEPSHLQFADTVNKREEKYDNLVPEIPEVTDPSQILSPSKRKAYERRIERLKVTTSPIARPRSTTPINVVTLDEYAAISSSPDASPASPSVLQDKLKITLPADEFAAKPKTPKHHSGKRRTSEDTVFQFSEETLFSRTKSALLVEDDGHFPLSPRRVLLPPTLTPTSSPRLSASPRLTKPVEAENIPPTVSFSQQKSTVHKFFGETVDEIEEENWASFPEPSPTIEAPPSVLIPGLYNCTHLEAADVAQQSSNLDAEFPVNICDNIATDCIGAEHNPADTPSQLSTAFITARNQTTHSGQPTFSEKSTIKQEKTESLVKVASPESDLYLPPSKISAFTAIDPSVNVLSTETAALSLAKSGGDGCGHDSTNASQESSLILQADPNKPNVSSDDNVLFQEENCSSLTDIEKDKYFTCTPLVSRESSNATTSVIDDILLVEQNQHLETSTFGNSAVNKHLSETSTSIVDYSQISLLSDGCQPSLAASNVEPKETPNTCNSPLALHLIQSDASASFAQSLEYTQPQNLLLQDSKPEHSVLQICKSHNTVLEGSRKQTPALEDPLQHPAFFQDCQTQQTELKDLQPQNAVLRDSQRRDIGPEDCQTELEDYQGQNQNRFQDDSQSQYPVLEVCQLHQIEPEGPQLETTGLEHYSPQTIFLETNPPQNSLLELEDPQLLQVELTSPQHGQSNSGTEVLEQLEAPNDLDQAPLPSSGLDLGHQRSYIGVLGSNQEEGVKHELEELYNLPNPTGTCQDLNWVHTTASQEDTHPLPASADHHLKKDTHPFPASADHHLEDTRPLPASADHHLKDTHPLPASADHHQPSGSAFIPPTLLRSSHTSNPFLTDTVDVDSRLAQSGDNSEDSSSDTDCVDVGTVDKVSPSA
ncbi:hypothetical protein ElyMa_003090600 [Elysia marginata]|uniref:Uncharacterized protein n=1 Tax=Elysia marginata TaxID=1093978 RepID=A0AAV4IPD4_9GAST|nr:hypothetical protein ElyMa_003090600 [Elysia marginata]